MWFPFSFRTPNVKKMGSQQNINGLLRALKYKHSQQLRSDAMHALIEIGQNSEFRYGDENKGKRQKFFSKLRYRLENSRDKEVISRVGQIIVESGYAYKLLSLAEYRHTRDEIWRYALSLSYSKLDYDIKKIAEVWSESRYRGECLVTKEALIKLGSRAVSAVIDTVVDLYRCRRSTDEYIDIFIKMGYPALQPLIQALENTGKKAELSALALMRFGRPALSELLNILESKNDSIKLQREVIRIVKNIDSSALTKYVDNINDIKMLSSLLDASDDALSGQARERLILLGKTATEDLVSEWLYEKNEQSDRFS